jgi:hypothetical protein
MHTLNIGSIIVVVHECIQDGSTLVIIRHCREKSKKLRFFHRGGNLRKAGKVPPRSAGKVKATPLRMYSRGVHDKEEERK